MLELNSSRDGSSIDVDEKWMDSSVEGLMSVWITIDDLKSGPR
jgi:hypothetical protein